MGDKTEAFEATTSRLWGDWKQGTDGAWFRDEPGPSWWRVGAGIAAGIVFGVALGFSVALLVWQIGYRGGVW